MYSLLQMIARVCIGIFLLYLGYSAFFFFMQRHVLFPGRQIQVPPGATGRPPAAEQLWLDTAHGRVEAWFLPAVQTNRTAPAPTVIYAHGNGEIIDFLPDALHPLTQMGVGVLLVEYPGYGRSDGTPSQQSITEAFVAAYDTLVERDDVDAARIVFWGHSLGGGAVCALSTARPAAALILMSTFTSVRAFARDYHVPGFLVRDPFDNLAVVRTSMTPVLVIHGQHDTLIPYEHGLALYHAAQQGELLTYDCGHNDCPPEQDRFWRDIELFLRSAGVLAQVLPN